MAAVQMTIPWTVVAAAVIQTRRSIVEAAAVVIYRKTRRFVVAVIVSNRMIHLFVVAEAAPMLLVCHQERILKRAVAVVQVRILGLLSMLLLVHRS